MTKGVRQAPPRAAAMVESLRGLGYSPATAIADIIDNSISAKAQTVDVRLEWSGGESWVSIRDDGIGMSDTELEQAMQLGAKDPREKRDRSDLGRFGMGLKTASFSQARRLTVASRVRHGIPVCLRWDLDHLQSAEGADWSLHEGPAEGSEDIVMGAKPHDHGTLVLWEVLDRVVVPGFSENDFHEFAESIEEHLAMTFHRLITDGTVRITLNGRAIKPWDPFMEGHPGKALEGPLLKLGENLDIGVKVHILPHKDMLSDKELKAAAGPGGWTAQQGFYIYRNRRLIALGGWLRLRDERGRQFTRDEPHRLARILLDIPNTADSAWNINILKSTATPPVTIRAHLTRIAQEARERARRVFAHRGRLIATGTNAKEALPDIWSAYRKQDGTTYRIARDHALVQSVLEKAGPLRKEVEALLRLVEGTVPVQRIWLDTTEDSEPPKSSLSDDRDAEVLETMQELYNAFVDGRNMTPEEALARLGRTSPFNERLELLAMLRQE
ncbi:ATP-binding protein [Ruegeria atlantica]|uniref:ATP-binding protein n=1 Tax=Ruegeria atlantica TaxID=81569 RepID=UPI00249466D1|nr:ATP-binding protein [Ruegeria atlantica]